MNTVNFSDAPHLEATANEIARAISSGTTRLLLEANGRGAVLLASRVNDLLGPMTAAQREEVAQRFTGIGMPPTYATDSLRRPFRAPHWTASYAALCGSRKRPDYGEVQLARHGVLLLDQVAEFPRHVVRGMHYKAAGYPLVVIATAGPCPCSGYHNAKRGCHCTPPMVERYRAQVDYACRALGIQTRIAVPQA